MTSFSPSWLSGEPRALSFLPDRFRRSADRRDVVQTAAQRRVAPAVVEALAAHNAKLPPSAARERHLELLARPGTVAVVTGQQVGLFLGPLFTLYKAATAIVAARALSDETGVACVPIFWLQTEDHDLVEINECAVPRASAEPLLISLELSGAAASRVPVGSCLVGESVTAALAALRAELGAHPHGPELMALLERAYHPQTTMSEAFSQVVSEVFSDEGLILVDPRDPRLASQAMAVHKVALDDAAPIARALAARGKALEAAGFGEQVHVRPDAPLAFFSPDGVDGPRYRFETAAQIGAWKLVGHPGGGSVTTHELSAWLEREPLRFTTSALLRPMLQDTLLPTAAYVGGPAEVAYFAQLAPLYEHFGLPVPLVLPRARFRVLDDRTRSLLAKLGLSADDAAQPRQALLARIVSGEGFDPPDAVEARLVGPMLPELVRLKERMTTLDPSFAKTVARTEESVRESVGRLVAKYGKALALRDQTTNERVDRLRAYLMPGGVPQERVYGLPYFAARYGTRAFVKMVLDACEPFGGQLKDLTP